MFETYFYITIPSMTRKELLFTLELIGIGAAGGYLLANTSNSDQRISVEEKLARLEKERYEQHKRVANLMFNLYQEYINVNADPEFYSYAVELIREGQFSPYKEDIYGIVFPWVTYNDLQTPGFPNRIGLVINYPETQKFGGIFSGHAQSDQDVTLVYKPFISLYIQRDLKIVRDEQDYQKMQPFNERDFAAIWPNIFRDPPPSYNVRDIKYTKGNLEAISENNLRNGKNVTYSIFSNGMVRVFIP